MHFLLCTLSTSCIGVCLQLVIKCSAVVFSIIFTQNVQLQFIFICFVFQNQQGQNTDGNLIPQIVMNPWDHSQGVQMTLATNIAQAMTLQQAYQKQAWLAAQQQVSILPINFVHSPCTMKTGRF